MCAVKNYLFVVALLVSSLMGFSSDTLFIRNGHIVTPENHDAVRSMLIQNGCIAAIGADLTAPVGVAVIDAQGQYLYPGMIAPFTSLGLVGYPGSASDTDESGSPTTEMDPADGLNPEDDSIGVARIDGITDALIVSGTRMPINGYASLMRLHGSLTRDLITHHKLCTVINLAARQKQYPSTLPGLMALLRTQFSEGESGKDPLMKAILRGEQRVIMMAPDSVTIRNALQLIETFKLNAVLMLRQEIEPYLTEIKRLNIPVIWAGATTMPRETEHPNHHMATAARLHEAGIRFCLTPGYGPESRHVRRLPVVAALCVAHGLPKDAAFDAITIETARILGVDRELGSLEVGKRAHLIICDRTPVDPGSRISHVIIDGCDTPMNNYQTELYKKFDAAVKAREKESKTILR